MQERREEGRDTEKTIDREEKKKQTTGGSKYKNRQQKDCERAS